MTNKKFHIGIIPDGARRWAKDNFKEEGFAYIQTMNKLFETLNYLFYEGATSISIYLCSKKNILYRPSENKSNFLNSQEFFLTKLVPKLQSIHDIQIIVAGNIENIPKSYQEHINFITKSSNKNAINKLYLLINYCPLDELNFALKNNKKIELNNFWVNEEIDLVFRTGVKGRISDFLPIQSSFAELVFIDKYFPDLLESDLDIILKEFNLRKRRFGH